MEGKFVYVFDKDARDKLLASNYILLTSDELRGIYVFENAQTLNFSLFDSGCIYTDTLTF